MGSGIRYVVGSDGHVAIDCSFIDAGLVSKTLIFAASAARDIEKLPEAVRERLLRALYHYGRSGLGDIKRMIGGKAIRMRDGDYRVIFDETGHKLFVLALGHRRDIYR